MLKYTIENVMTAKCIGFQCNRCKKEFDEGTIEFSEKFHLTHVGGYGSKWGDGSTYDITLCDDCTHDLLSPYAELQDPDQEITEE